MDKLLFAKQKLAQIKAEISRVRTSDFHHPRVKRVLDAIDRVFDRMLLDIEKVSPSASVDILNERNLRVNVCIEHFHRVIGVILRSTNARNSFEIYDPILRLAQGLLGDDTVLIQSSEWEFVPFTTPSVFGGVPDCTIVGLPVMESGNALVTPLAGHELGHAVWRAKKLNDRTDSDRQSALCDIFLENWEIFREHTFVQSEGDMRSRLGTNEWGQVPLDVMEKVCEELFCDMLGVRLFGMGYLYAFEYLAAPSLGETDLREYPAFDARARYLAEAVNQASSQSDAENPAAIWPRLDGYASRFSKEIPRLDPYDQFLLNSAHEACERLVFRLSEIAAEVCRSGTSVKVPSPTAANAREALSRYQRGLPAVGELADLVNAGWLRYLDQELWEKERARQKKEIRVLNELVFKSLDVTEFERRIADAAKVRQAA